MVKEIEGDLLYCGADIIGHQTNYYGDMGGGVAFAIRYKLLSPSEYAKYVNLCKANQHTLLGTVQCLQVDRPGANTPKYVFNLFCQSNQPQDDGGLTVYGQMTRCLRLMEQGARLFGMTVAVPGYLGCGIAGGNWRKVNKIIHDVFDDSPVECSIVYLPGQGCKGR